VTPIVYEGQNKRSVYFPGKGESWYNFKIDIKTGRAKVDNLSLFEGGSKANISNPLPNAPPTYLRGGFGLLLNQP
jgi:alpha-glucosidase (family GH31 glycosyl hydrolase)